MPLPYHKESIIKKKRIDSIFIKNRISEEIKIIFNTLEVFLAESINVFHKLLILSKTMEYFKYVGH